MRILLVTPAPPGSRSGNRVTAGRWEGILAELGHAPEVAEEYPAGGGACDLLIALHARRSAPSVARFRDERPEAPLILACTGTDLYRDLAAGDRGALRSVAAADRLVVLHPLALDELPPEARPHTRVIIQSVRLPPELEGAAEGPPPRLAADGPFRVLVAAHLREVKDPLRGALAARMLPEDSTVEITHLGGVLDPELANEARRLSTEEPRYTWRGEVDRTEALRTLAQSHCLLISSRMEGAPNVLSEALALGVPVIATDIPGCVGLLGSDHPALYPPGDTEALARLLRRVETDPGLYRELRDRSRRLSHLVRRETERDAWRSLLAELGIQTPAAVSS